MPSRSKEHGSGSADSPEEIVQAYSRFVPRQILELMGKDRITRVNLGDHAEMTMTILFADIRNFSSLSEEMSPKENFEFINSFLERMVPAITRNRGIVDKFIGDGIMALFPTAPDDALQGAIDMLEALGEYNQNRKDLGYPPIRIGIGLNTGLMTVGVIGGKERFANTVVSNSVNLASRVESLTKDYSVSLLISEHTYYGLVDASLHDVRFVDRVKVKGLKQPQSVYEVFDVDPDPIRDAKRVTKSLFEEALAHYHLKEVSTAQELLSRCLNQAPEDSVAQVYRARCERFLQMGLHESSGEVDLLIRWDDSFKIGHPEIDAQHRELFERAGEFIDSVRKTHDYVVIDKLIGFLNDYAAKHFETEENCMAEKGYPFLELQIDQHRRFSKRIDALRDQIRKDVGASRIYLLFRAQILLVDWIVNHTSKMDRHFGRFLSMME